MRLRRTEEAFREALPSLLAEREMSQRELARRLGINSTYLTFVVKGQRPPSRRLLEGAARELGLSADYFREYRELVVVESVKADVLLLDRVYRLVTARKG